jgi:glycosidase
MLYFLENHDEQRLASDFFAGDARRGIPGLMVSAWLQQNPLMLYAGQEFGERGMDKEGFSGKDGRTTIFDYWCVDTIRRGFYHRRKLTDAEKALEQQYRQIVNLAQREKAIREGQFYDLMYAQSVCFDRQHVYAFLRNAGRDSLLILVNFGEQASKVSVNIPKHAVDFLGLPTGDLVAKELLTGDDRFLDLMPDVDFPLTVPALGGVVLKF